jgi:hypothetical protein
LHNSTANSHPAKTAAASVIIKRSVRISSTTIFCSLSAIGNPGCIVFLSYAAGGKKYSLLFLLVYPANLFTFRILLHTP